MSVKPRRPRGARKYTLDSVDLDEAAEHERFADYMAHYGVAYEN